jgi:hypothetical protein
MQVPAVGTASVTTPDDLELVRQETLYAHLAIHQCQITLDLTSQSNLPHLAFRPAISNSSYTALRRFLHVLAPVDPSRLVFRLCAVTEDEPHRLRFNAGGKDAHSLQNTLCICNSQLKLVALCSGTPCFPLAHTCPPSHTPQRRGQCTHAIPIVPIHVSTFALWKGSSLEPQVKLCLRDFKLYQIF